MNWLWALSVTAAALLFFVAIFAAVRWYLKHETQEEDRINYPEPPMLQHGVSGTPIENFQGTPFLRSEVKRAVLVPKDVWAELQAMPNDGSWSTRQLVRAIQRANKKKRGKA